ncbi:MAG: type III pantothenate kinase [Chitinivibrionales bacterium]|nr:type III pantothenate kinase [Chitinivibrionales bacterium]
MNADNAQPVLAIDIGNSMAKVGVVDTHSWRCRARLSFTTATLEEHFAHAVEELSTVFSGERGVPVAVANVADASVNEIERMLAGKHLGPLIMVAYDPTLPLSFAYQDPSTLGADRIANAFYCRQSRSGRDAIMIAAGTAVTVDLITAEGRFAGGAILPGPGTQLHSLHAAAAALPEVLPAGVQDLRPGTTTESCMTVGVLASVAGGIERLVEQFSMDCDEQPDLIATGGAWPLVARLLKATCTHVPDATLIGIAAFATAKADQARARTT